MNALHIESGQRRTAGNGLEPCYILVDDAGTHIAATDRATGSDWSRANRISDAVNSYDAMREALTWALDQIEDDLDLDHQAALSAARAALALADHRQEIGP